MCSNTNLNFGKVSLSRKEMSERELEALNNFQVVVADLLNQMKYEQHEEVEIREVNKNNRKLI